MAQVYKLASETVVANKPVETDEQIIARLRNRFTILENMTRAVKTGKVRSMIVSGPPGVGKSHGVEQVLKVHDTIADIAGDPGMRQYEIVKGTMSALHLYLKLYTYKDPKNIVVFDDCDSVLLDDESLGLLKTALDSTSRRTISWHKASRILQEADIPNSFDFMGGCIFITNLKFDSVRSKKLRDHLAALESRSHYLDLTIDTEREKVLRIKQIVADGMLHKYRLGEDVETEIIEFINDNKHRMRELSLRMVIKAAELVKSFGNGWKEVAELTLMT